MRCEPWRITWDPEAIKCQFCRIWFKRSASLPSHIPAVACPAAVCQERLRVRTEERSRAATLRPDIEPQRPLVVGATGRAAWARRVRSETLRPDVLN
jgi:hypothetical protein